MRALHVAALPFPSPQGTQALVGHMLTVLARTGHEVELLTYAHGVAAPPPPFALRRAPAVVRGRSLRSGPSLEKLALDVGLGVALRERACAFVPEVVVAHHVEAALLALSVVAQPVLFVAHTGLEAELPSFLPAWAPPVVRTLSARAGVGLERALCRRAAHTVAVSPLLARTLEASSGRSVAPLVVPWDVPPEAPRVAAPGPPRLAYVGNLDAYQGLDVLADGLAVARARGLAFELTVATASAHGPFAARLARSGVPARFVALADEEARTRLYAATDLALVPRAAAGGLPIKLLDAMARAVPVLAADVALAGLPLDSLCRTFPAGDPHAFAAALTAELAEPRERRLERAGRARAHVALLHGDGPFVASYGQALARAAGRKP